MKSLCRRSLLFFLVSLLVLQPACAPVRPDYLAQPDKSRLGRVGIAVGRFDPQYKFEALTSGKGEGAAKGALGGALQCGEIGRGGGNNIAVALVFIVCLPVAAVVGAVHGASSTESSDNIKSTQANINAKFASVGQEPLRQALARYAQDTGLALSPLPHEQGPATPGDAPAYGDFAKDVDTVLEVTALDLTARTSGGNTLPIGLQVKAAVRVVNARDGTVVDSFPVKSTPIWRPLEEWLADGARPVQAGIEAALREVAETAIDEAVLIYHPLSVAANAEKDLVPDYALRTIQPPLRTRYEMSHPRWAHLERYQLASTTPAFEWENFPRGYDIDIGEGAGQARDVKYDFRIYAEGGILYERTGLIAPKHTLEFPLEPCREYRWTARARFRVKDSVRATEWMGAFDTIGSTSAPWWWRRGSKPALAVSPPNISYYPIIVTPGDDGHPCKKQTEGKVAFGAVSSPSAAEARSGPPASAAISTAPAAVEKPAEASTIPPAVVVGDKWTYRLSDQGRVLGSVSVEILAVNGSKVRERFTREGYRDFSKEREVDATFNPTRFQTVAFPGGYDLPEFAPYLPPNTELKKGRGWDGIIGVFFMHHAGKVTLTSNIRIVGQETVQVPAGSFRTWKIETDSPEVASSGIYVKAKCIYWYSPEAKRTVKMSIDSITSMQAYASDVEVFELVSFRPGTAVTAN